MISSLKPLLMPTSSIFNEYLSSVIASLSKKNKEYHAMQAEIDKLYKQYPKVLGMFDSEQAAELTEKNVRLLSKLCS